jgi:hypothetical protein
VDVTGLGNCNIASFVRSGWMVRGESRDGDRVYPWKGVCKLARLSLLQQLTNYDDFIRLGRRYQTWGGQVAWGVVLTRLVASRPNAPGGSSCWHHLLSNRSPAAPTQRLRRVGIPGEHHSRSIRHSPLQHPDQMCQLLSSIRTRPARPPRPGALDSASQNNKNLGSHRGSLFLVLWGRECGPRRLTTAN